MVYPEPTVPTDLLQSSRHAGRETEGAYRRLIGVATATLTHGSSRVCLTKVTASEGVPYRPERATAWGGADPVGEPVPIREPGRALDVGPDPRRDYRPDPVRSNQRGPRSSMRVFSCLVEP